MNKTLFTGVCTAMVTPFIGDKINYPMAEQLLRRQIALGISAVVVSGTTGEAPTLTDEEKTALIRHCKSYAAGRCMIIAGTGSNSTEHAIKLSKEAELAGADALLVVTPYYNKATPKGLIAHYLAIANAVSIPVILYNVPSRTGVDIPVEVYRALSNIPNIIGVKEASTDLTKISKIRAACGDDFSIWSGNDELAVPIISLGGKGVISVTSNLFPEEMNAMVLAALDGDFDSAADLQCRLLPFMELLFCEVNPIPVKAAMKKIGYDCGDCRLPLTSLSDANQKKMDELLH